MGYALSLYHHLGEQQCSWKPAFSLCTLRSLWLQLLFLGLNMVVYSAAISVSSVFSTRNSILVPSFYSNNTPPRLYIGLNPDCPTEKCSVIPA